MNIYIWEASALQNQSALYWYDLFGKWIIKSKLNYIENSSNRDCWMSVYINNNQHIIFFVCTPCQPHTPTTHFINIVLLFSDDWSCGCLRTDHKMYDIIVTILWNIVDRHMKPLSKHLSHLHYIMVYRLNMNISLDFHFKSSMKTWSIQCLR